MTTALLLLLMSALALGAAEWKIEVVDAKAVGKFSSLRIDTAGNAHVSYVDPTQLVLKYAFWDSALNKWFTTTLDRSSGFSSLTLDSKQHPHISYTAYGVARVKYAFWNGSKWEKPDIQIPAKDISYYTSIVLDENDRPTISYYEYWGMSENYTLRLRKVTWDGKVWEVRTIDQTPGSGKFNSMKIDSTGQLHIAYANVKDENAGLRYAKWNGRSWDVDVLEGAQQPRYVYSVMLALDKRDQPHVTYTDVNTHVVRYAARIGKTWRTESVDALSEEGYPDRNGIAITEQGDPYISYYDAGAGMLKLAHRENGRWVIEIVDQNFAGFTSSLVIDHDTIWITYAGESGYGLKCARRKIETHAASRSNASEATGK